MIGTLGMTCDKGLVNVPVSVQPVPCISRDLYFDERRLHFAPVFLGTDNEVRCALGAFVVLVQILLP